MMKDKIRILKDYSVFDYKCPFCNKKDHLFFECSKLHFIPDRDFLIKKINFSVEQVRIKPFFRQRTRKINALFQNFNIHLASLKINEIEDDEDEDDIEEEQSDPNINLNNQDLPSSSLLDKKFIRGRKSKIISAAQTLTVKENEKKMGYLNTKSQNYLNFGEFNDNDDNVKIKGCFLNYVFFKNIQEIEIDEEERKTTVKINIMNESVTENPDLFIRNIDKRKSKVVHGKNSLFQNHHEIEIPNIDKSSLDEKKIVKFEGEENTTQSLVIFDGNFDIGLDYQWYFPHNNCKEIIAKLQTHESGKIYEKKMKKGKTKKIPASPTKRQF